MLFSVSAQVSPHGGNVQNGICFNYSTPDEPCRLGCRGERNHHHRRPFNMINWKAKNNENLFVFFFVFFCFAWKWALAFIAFVHIEEFIGRNARDKHVSSMAGDCGSFQAPTTVWTKHSKWLFCLSLIGIFCSNISDRFGPSSAETTKNTKQQRHSKTEKNKSL